MIFLNSVDLMSFLNDVLYDKLREKPPEDIRVEIDTYGLSFSDKKFKKFSSIFAVIPQIT